jgi:hypothetical protein
MMPPATFVRVSQKNLAAVFSRGIFMRFAFAAMAGLVGLAAGGCSTVQSLGEDEYVVTSATPDSITLRFREGNLNKATERAAAHCSATNRPAQMVNVSPADGYSVAAFRCGPNT